MLKQLSARTLEQSVSSVPTLILIGSIFAGSLLGYLAPTIGQQFSKLIDITLLLLVSLLFFGIRFEALRLAIGNWRFLSLALVANFLLVPLLGYFIASLFVYEYSLLFVGLVIYFMAPCTDWFLGFTKLSGGNVALGSALLPINMILQLALYPFYLHLFTQQIVEIHIALISSNLLNWFLLPLVIAILLHQILRKSLIPSKFEVLLIKSDKITAWLIGFLVFLIFAANVNVIVEHHAVFIWILLAVFTFFLFTFLLSEGLTYLFRLQYSEHVLLTMTIAARNAPMMLAVTMLIIPGQPLIYAALVIGMLIELPHLTVLRRLLLTRQQQIQYRDMSVNTSVD